MGVRLETLKIGDFVVKQVSFLYSFKKMFTIISIFQELIKVGNELEIFQKLMSGGGVHM